MKIGLSFPIVFFFFNDTATTEIYTLSLHDALPTSLIAGVGVGDGRTSSGAGTGAREIAMSRAGPASATPHGRARRITVPMRSRCGLGDAPGSGTASGRPRGNEPYGRSALVGTNLGRV